MCGRFALFSSPSMLARRFGTETTPGMEARYNIAPSQAIPIVRKEGDERRFAMAHWGLIPFWAKDAKIGYSMINARAETVAEKPAFRTAFKQRRCLIPADGFYEWQALPGAKTKQPWFVSLRNREPMAFAGLWEIWKSPEGRNLESCTIIVTAANDLMQPIHERMPVILAPEDWETWLAPHQTNPKILKNLLQPYPGEEMTAWRVSMSVNNPKNDSEECTEPVA
jgi:putative SOS response-associated peptidase YedK